MVRRLATLILLAAFAAFAQPVVSAGGVVNAADYSRDFAPGALISIFGQNLAAELATAPGTPLPTSLGGASVEATDGTNTWTLPLYMVSPGQINAQLPYGVSGSLGIRVVTEAGASAADTIFVGERAPKLFAWNEGGFGRAVLTHHDEEATPVDRQNPVKPGEYVSIWANSLGEVDPPATAGEPANDGSAGKPLQVVTTEVVAAIDGVPATVNFAGLAPYFAGLYQIDVLTPYSDVIGDVEIAVGAGGIQSQANISVPVEPNGFYWTIPAGKFPNGQTKTAQSGPWTAIMFYHEAPDLWGENGYKQWTPNTLANGADFANLSGLAFTLMNGNVIVYDNNGIEDGTHGGFYNNEGGAIPDEGKASLTQWFSMSGNYRGIFATHFRAPESITFDTLIAYFDGNGLPELRFDPFNIYNTYRMNIWSTDLLGRPAVNSFTGNIFSTDDAAGQFSISQTDVDRVFQDGARDPIYRLVFKLDRPMTLPAGEYWFSSDLHVPDSPRAPAASADTADGMKIRRSSSAERVVPQAPVVTPAP